MFNETHRFFKIELTGKDTIWGSVEADMCKQHLGDTDPNSWLVNRKWFTAPDGIYVRKDCLNNKLVTWFALRSE